MSTGRAAAAALAGAIAAVRRGEVVAVPTETVYGLAADPTSARASAALFAVKGRPPEVALPVLVPGPAAALALAAPGPAADGLERLAERFWPGPLTVVVPRVTSARLFLGGEAATVGLRFPDCALVVEVLDAVGPLAVTSANYHGGEPCTTASAVRAVFGDALGAVVDGGTCAGEPSTVVSLVGGSPVVLRPGPISLADIVGALGPS